MLVIRDEQLAVLGGERLKQFEGRLLAHCRQAVEAAGVRIDELSLATSVRASSRQALRYFKAERDVARYCEIVLFDLGGRTMDLPEAAVQILQSDALAAGVRLRNFEHWARQQRT